MPPLRRMKIPAIVAFILIAAILFWSSSIRQQSAQGSQSVGDFYDKTVSALDKEPDVPPSGKTEDDEEVTRAMAERLKKAAQVAKDNANAKAPKPDPPSSLVGVGSAAEGGRSVAGRKKFPAADSQEPIKESQEDHDAEVELNNILKKSPIIIFSKSYCPYSRRAKGILLEKYIIDPTPFVVELDQHPLGAKLQARLAELTTRKTVPNILINGVSIGGGDDVAELDTQKTLIDKVKDLGGKKITDVRLRPIEDDDHGLK